MSPPCGFVLNAYSRPGKQRPVRLTIPPVESAKDLLAAMIEVVAETAAGHVAPDEGMSFASLLAQHLKVFDVAEIEGKIAELSVKYEELWRQYNERAK
jgi:hypothetical protein